jgi:hypothetical protein
VPTQHMLLHPPHNSLMTRTIGAAEDASSPGVSVRSAMLLPPALSQGGALRNHKCSRASSRTSSMDTKTVNMKPPRILNFLQRRFATH